MLITDHRAGRGRALEESVRESLGAGLPCLMLREKDLPRGELLDLAHLMRRMTNETGAMLIMNRAIDAALVVGADGVHLGADGPTIEEARDTLGEQAWIGYSAHAHTEAGDALRRGADYVTYSPIFSTPSKQDLEPVGIEALGELVAVAPGPVVALGGIDGSNLEQVLKARPAGIALIRAILAAPSPATATAQLLRIIEANA